MKKTGFLLFILCFIAASFVQAKIADDPARIGVGARPLGLGKAYVGLADDASAIFLNPAGLAQINHPQAASLSGRLLNEITYFNAGAVIPTLKGVLGIGYMGSDFGFTSSTTTIEGGRVVASNESASYLDEDSVLLLSYAVPADGLFGWKIFDRISLGTTLKLFSKKLSGGTVSGGSAYGRDLDVGVLIRPHDAVKFGLAAQNILPAGMGGKIVWNSGAVETLPAMIKGGTSVKVIGENGFYFVEDQRLIFNLDADYYSGLSQVPVLFHLGAEWSPVRFLDIRLGIDQETAGQSVANNLSAGIGLKKGKFRFDYAYHQYDSLPDMSNHFFSISYGLFDQEDIALQAARLEREKIEREKREKERIERERLLREQREIERKELEVIERKQREIEKQKKMLLAEEKNKREEAERKKREEERIRQAEARRIEIEQRAQMIRRAGANLFGNIGNVFSSAGKAVGGAFGAAGQNVQSAGSNLGSAWDNFFKPAPAPPPKPAPGVEGREPAREEGPVVEKKNEVQVIRESLGELAKIFSGERPLEDLGAVIPQIATSLIVLVLKVGLFLFVLLVILLLFKDWERRTQ